MKDAKIRAARARSPLYIEALQNDDYLKLSSKLQESEKGVKKIQSQYDREKLTLKNVRLNCTQKHSKYPELQKVQYDLMQRLETMTLDYDEIKKQKDELKKQKDELEEKVDFSEKEKRVLQQELDKCCQNNSSFILQCQQEETFELPVDSNEEDQVGHNFDLITRQT